MFNAIGSSYLNPEGKLPTYQKGGDVYYEKEIVDKVPDFVLILVSIFLFVGLTGSIMISSYEYIYLLTNIGQNLT